MTERNIEYNAYLRVKIRNIALKKELQTKQQQFGDQLMVKTKKLVQDERQLQELERVKKLKIVLLAEKSVKQAQQAGASLEVAALLEKLEDLSRQLDSASQMLNLRNVLLYNDEDTEKHFIEEMNGLHELLENVEKDPSIIVQGKIAAQLLQVQETMKSFNTTHGICQSTEYMALSNLLAKVDACFPKFL